MKRALGLAAVLSFAWAAGAGAAVTTAEQIMQSGQFVKAGCKPDPKDPDYDPCACDADVRYPQISGISDSVTQARLNDWFKQQAAKTVCEGDKTAPAKNADKSAKSHMSISVHYEVTLATDHVLAFKFTDWAYTGGAHGNGSIIGVIVDLDKGKLLEADDVFGKNLSAVNDAIYDALAAKPEEEIFRDQVEARKGAFIKDGECQGCTLTLGADGVHVLFQTYEVAPYGAGDVSVLIPAKYVSYGVVKEALASPPAASAAKKK